MARSIKKRLGSNPKSKSRKSQLKFIKRMLENREVLSKLSSN